MLVPDIVEYTCPEDKLPSPLPNSEEVDAAVDSEGSEILVDDAVYGYTLFRYNADYLIFFGPGVDAHDIRTGRQRIKGIAPLTRIYAIFSAIRNNYLFNYVILENSTMKEPKKMILKEENGRETAVVKTEGSPSSEGVAKASPQKRKA